MFKINIFNVHAFVHYDFYSILTMNLPIATGTLDGSTRRYPEFFFQKLL